MNKTLSTTLTVLAVLALAAVIFFAGSMYARTNSIGYSMMGGWNNDNAYGPNMMNGRGPGMMQGYGNNNTYGPGGMMGGYSYKNADLPTLTVEQVKAAAEKYLANLNNSDFEIAEIMIFDNNGYVIVKEASTGVGAFELLVDPVSQTAYPEHGPNMMWNTKYSGLNHEYMMGNGGMMGGYGNMMQGWDNTTPLNVPSEMTVNPEQAEKYAQQYLDDNIAGATVEHPMPFYGYYTLDFEKDGTMAGMLSINGYNGQVFLHTWHGTFIEEVEYE
ncbi:MAG TPA: hypothetical protein VLA72_14735 [Anaerolineales bacterium]|nr:hypothetical protein [Anaerolineales bacterium]